MPEGASIFITGVEVEYRLCLMLFRQHAGPASHNTIYASWCREAKP